MANAVRVNVLDGNLGLQPGSNQNTVLLMGCCLGNNAGGGVANTLYNFGDPVTAANSLVGGELLEMVTYVLKSAPGSIVQAMPLNPTTRGGIGTFSKVGTGALVITPTLAPHGAITITCTTGGTLGTAAFTFGVTNPITGVTTTSAPVTSAAGWSGAGYQIPGTYVTWVATAGTYISGGSADIYTISTLGAITHPQGAGPAVGTFTASPVDSYYKPQVTITLGGAVGTSQFTYSLDGGSSNSATITSSASYAIPGTGIVLGFSGTAVAGDVYTCSGVAAPTFANTDLTAAGTALTTTFVNSFFSSLIGIVGAVASAAAWATQVAATETIALSFNALNVYPRFLVGGPTVGTVLPNAGSVTVDAADTDSVVIAARAGMSAPHVCVAAGDGLMAGAYTGLVFRRNAVWAAIGRAAAVQASQDVGAFADGGVTSFTSCVRDDFANALSFFNSGITSLQTYGAGSAVFINRGLMGTVSTSDYYTLTNARVIDQASGIAVLAARPYILARIPTQTRNGVQGTIREDYAQKIESKMNTAEQAGLPVAALPIGNAVAVNCTVTRTNNIYSSGQLILTVAVQPWSYPTTVIVNIGMTLQAS
jgi:hypothetical protein